MKLITKEIENRFKKYPLGSQDGKMGNSEVIAKFFNPTGAGTWYITEGSYTENGDIEMFGYCHLGDDEMAEFGTIMLSSLENIKLPFGMTIERDLYLKDGLDIVQALKRDGIEIPEYIKQSYIEKEYKKTNIYEHESIIITKPDVEPSQVINEYDSYFKSIANNVITEDLGIKKLAYEIKKMSEGHYFLFQYETDKDNISNIESKFRLDDDIIKFITIRKDPVIDDRDYNEMEYQNTIKLQKGDGYSYEDGLKQRVQEKLTNEYNDFINQLKYEEPLVIIDKAYEKVCKEEMVYSFEKKDLSANECKALLKCKNILDDCYSNWLKSDGNFNEMLEYAIDDSVENITKTFEKNQKNKNKDSR